MDNCMARPRSVIPGTTQLLTRRVFQRTFRLRPHPVTNQVIRYCLAWAANKFGILVHAVVAMSNHMHIVATDTRGLMPDFLREMHRNIAKALNVSQHQVESLWSPERASVVRLPTIDDALRKIAYVAANPVAAGLVRSPDEWPGVVHFEPGTVIEVERPTVYFDPEGQSPESVKLEIVPLAGVGGEDRCSWTSQVHEAVTEAVVGALAKLRSRGIKILGKARVLRTSFLAHAKRYEARFQVDPILAARDIVVRETCILAERAFQRAYRTALEAWRAGDRLATFPFGTWWMRVHHAAAVVPACAATFWRGQ